MSRTPDLPRAILLARNSFWIACDTATSVAASFIASIAVARVLGPETLGHYAYVMWVANSARVIASSGLAVGVRKYAAEFLGRGDPGTARAVVRLAFRWQAGAGAVLVVAALLFALPLVRPEHRTFTALALLSLLPSLVLGVSAGAVEATQDFAANVKSSIVGNLTNLAGIALALVRGWGLTGLAASLLASRVVDSVLRYVTYRHAYDRVLAGGGDRTARLARETKERILGFTWQVTLLAAINAVVWDRSELFFLERMRDIREVAFYSLSFGLVQQLLTIPQAFTFVAGSNLYVEQGRDPSSLGRLAAIVVRYVALVAFPLTWGFAALSPSVIHLVYGSAYAPAAPVLAILAVGAAPVAFLTSAQNLLIATERQAFLLRWTAAVALLNLTLDLLLVPVGGGVGAAIANATSQAVAVAGIWVFIVRRLAFRPPASALLKTALSASAAAGLAALCGLFLPPIAAALVGTALGALTYLSLVRLCRILEPEDADRLLSLRRLLPAWARSLYSGIIRRAFA